MLQQERRSSSPPRNELRGAAISVIAMLVTEESKAEVFARALSAGIYIGFFHSGFTQDAAAALRRAWDRAAAALLLPGCWDC